MLDLSTSLDVAYAGLTEWLRTDFVQGAGALGLWFSGATCDLTQAQLAALTEPHLDRIHRFARLARRLGWSTIDLDRAITVLGSGALDEALLVKLSVVKRLQATLSIPLTELLTWWGPLDTRRWKGRLVSGRPASIASGAVGTGWVFLAMPTIADGGLSPYDALFQNPSATASPDTAFALNAQGTALAVETLALVDHAAAVTAGLGITAADLAVLTPRLPTDRLTLANLSLLYRHVSLARALGLNIPALVQLLVLTGATPFDPTAPANALAFVREARAARTAPLSIDQLNYLLRDVDTTPPTLIPTDTAIGVVLLGLGDALRSAITDDAKRATVLAKLGPALGLDAGLLAPLLDTYVLSPSDGTTHALADFQGITNGAAPVTGAPIPPIATAPAYATYRRLAKVALLLKQLRITVDELPWVLGALAANRPLDVNTLPVTAGAPVASYAGWQRLRTAAQLRDQLPARKLFDLFTTAAASGSAADYTALVDALAQRSSWSRADLVTLIGAPAGNAGNPPAVPSALGLAYPADWLDERAFARIVDALGVIGRVGASAATIAPWASIPAAPADRVTQADGIRQAVRAHYSDPDQWRAVAAPLRDALRERQRDALVAWLCAHDDRFASPDDLYGYLLIDVLISPCQLTSRIRQAMSSAQQFVQRALLGLEPTVELAPGDADEWTTWRKSYAVWAANREVFLWPEDWIDPSLRDDKTPLFEALEQALAQGEITAENAETAVTAYLHGLDELARLEIVATITDDDTGVLHVFGRTRNTPADYYHRQRSAGAWTPWRAMDVQIDDDHLVPAIFQNRLYVFWPQFSTASVQNDVTATPSGPGDKTQSLPLSYYQIKLAWSQYRDGAWLPRTLSNVRAGDPIAPSTLPLLIVDNVKSTSNIFFHTAEIDGDMLIEPVWFERDYGVGGGSSANRADGFRLSGCDGTMAIAPIGPGSLTGFSINAPPNTFPYNQTYSTDATLSPPPNTEPVSLIWRDPNSSSYHAEPVLGASDGPIVIVPESLQDFGVGDKTPFFLQDRHRTFLVTPNQQRWVPQPPIWLTGDTVSLEPVALFGALDRPAVPRPNAWQTDPRTSQQVTTTVRATTPPAFKALPPPPPNTTTGPVPSLSLVGLPGVGNQQLASALGARVAYIGNAPVMAPSPKISVTSQVTVLSSDGTELITSRSAGANADGSFATFTIDQRFTMPPVDVTDAFQGTVLAPTNKGDFLFTPFYHPYVCTMLRQVALYGMDGLYRPTTSALPPRQTLTTTFFPTTYQPVAVDQPYPIDRFDFSYGGAYSQYNWEVFFHVPFAIACRLSANQQFADAQRWFHYIFDPTDVSTDAPARQRCWKLRPFFELFYDSDADAGPLAELLLLLDYGGTDPTELAERDDLLAQIAAWRAEPFAPDAIARLRLVAYAKAVVRKYVDNLIAWGDQLFAHDSLESVEEATQVYVLASQILGPRPVTIPAEPPAAQTFDDLRANVDNFGEAIEEYLPDVGDPPDDDSSAPPALGSPYFCVPPNTQLVAETWDKVADRLFKIRHCLDLLGQPQQLPLFESPINPALLIQAQAAGVDLASALRDVDAPAPIHRYVVLAQKAGELCAEVRGLGQAMLAALEKQDGEELALLRADNELKLFSAMRQIRQQQVDEANATLAGLQAARVAADKRVMYYGSRPFTNVGEGMQFTLSAAAAAFDFAAEVTAGTGAIVGAIPDFTAGGAGFGGSPFVTATTGGSQAHHVNDALASSLQTLARLSDRAAGLAGLMGGYSRRQDDWDFQKEVAIQDRNSIDKQILAAQIRIAVAANELANLDLQISQARAVEDQLQSKYTNQQLYTWMVGQLSAIYQQGYQLAYAVAKEAEKAWQFELAQPTTTFIQFGYWDSLKKGLLAGERLGYDLRRMEVAYLDQNKREYELTSHVSLRLLDPIALEALRTTGECVVAVPESWFDLDTPGHYLRRLKTVAISLPCVAGPYVPVRCTLTLGSNAIRTSIDYSAGYASTNMAGDSRFHYDAVGGQAIVTSRALEDAGLFETNLRDERYLPFEGQGAIGTWHIQLPQKIRQFDYATITDAVLHVRYTARDTPRDPVTHNDFATAAQNSAGSLLTVLAQAISLREEMPDLLYQLLHPAPDASGQQITLPLTKDWFPYFVQGSTIAITGVDLFMPVTDLTGYQPIKFELTPPGGTTQSIVLASNDDYGSVPHGPVPPAANVTGAVGAWTLAFVEAENASATSAVVITANGHTRLAPEALRDLVLVVHYQVS